MKKGISPIVSVVLLIALAVIAAVGIYFWAAGLTTKQPTPQKPIPIVANPIETKPSRLAMLVANLGDRDLPAGTEIKATNGARALLTEPIPPGEQRLVVIYGGNTNTSTTPVEFNNSQSICIYASGTGSSCVKPSPAKLLDYGGPIVITNISQTIPWTDTVYYKNECRILFSNSSSFDIVEARVPGCNFSSVSFNKIISGTSSDENLSRPRYFTDNGLWIIYRDPSTLETKILEWDGSNWNYKSTVPLSCSAHPDASPSLSKLGNGSYIAMCSIPNTEGGVNANITYSLSNDLISWSPEKNLVTNFGQYVYGNPGSASLVYLNGFYYLVIPILHPVETIVENDGFIILRLNTTLSDPYPISAKSLGGNGELRFVPSAPTVVTNDGIVSVTGFTGGLVVNSQDGGSWSIPPAVIQSDSEGFAMPSITYDGRYYWLVYNQIVGGNLKLAARYSTDPLIWQ